MKTFLKFTVLSAILLTAQLSYANAEEDVLTSRRGTPVLPTAGTWALGIDASPFFNYFGRMFSDEGANAPTFTGGTFVVRYFLQDNRALRFRVTVNAWSDKSISLVNRVGSQADGLVENVLQRSSAETHLFFGYERRIGTTRLQGFYGFEGSLGVGSAGIRRTYTWGNALSEDNINRGSWRTLVDRPGMMFSIGANVFAGVEYFIAPGISLGAQVGYGINFRINGGRTIEEERWQWPGLQQRTIETSRTHAFNFNNFGGGITLMFHINRLRNQVETN
ncbi:MAG: hypothetical protein FWC10_09410 [Lentimicrobiaceae bacterium]|nr:hypothetical protein [Lentimicrobiaceae bacterium]